MVLSILIGLSGVLTQIQPNGNVIYLNGGDLPDIEVYDTVYRIDLSEATVAPLFENSVDITRVEQSKDGRRIILEGWGVYSKHVVDVISESGNHLLRLNNAVSATFIDPDGKRLAYAKGVANEKHRNVTQGTWIHFLETGDDERICDEGEKVRWVPFNNTLQITSDALNSRVCLYNLDTRELTESPEAKLNFSPCGSYHWVNDYAAHIVRLRDSKSGVSLLDEQGPLEGGRAVRSMRWMTDSIAVVYGNVNKFGSYILLVASGELRTSPDTVLAVSNDEKWVYVCKPGLVVEKLAMADLELVSAEKPSPANEE